jgi:hypothetical protein
MNEIKALRYFASARPDLGRPVLAGPDRPGPASRVPDALTVGSPSNSSDRKIRGSSGPNGLLHPIPEPMKLPDSLDNSHRDLGLTDLVGNPRPNLTSGGSLTYHPRRREEAKSVP